MFKALGAVLSLGELPSVDVAPAVLFPRRVSSNTGGVRL